MSEQLVMPNNNHTDPPRQTLPGAQPVSVDEALTHVATLRQRMFGFFVERRTRQESESPTRLQLHLLTRLAEREASTVSEIAGFLGVSRPTASQLTGALVERGWLDREMASSDQRRHRVALTAEGHALVKERQKAREARLRTILEALTPEERAALVHLSERIATLFLGHDGSGPPVP